MYIFLRMKFMGLLILKILHLQNTLLYLLTVLIQQAKPLHYREILEEIIKRGVSVGGREPGNTMVAYLGRDKRFTKAPEKGRGFWKLKEWENT